MNKFSSIPSILSIFSIALLTSQSLAQAPTSSQASKAAAATTASATATTTPPTQSPLTPDPKISADIVRALKGVTIYGSTFLPESHCNTATIENPDQLEVFQLKGKDVTLVLCPGTLDGEDNLVTIFSKVHPPQTTKLKPPMGSAHVSEQQIKDLVATFEAKPTPEQVETADVHKSTSGDFDSCLRNSKKQPPGFYVGESFSKSSTNRGMFEAMTLYACVSGNEVLFNPERRIQMVPAAAKIAYLNSACEKKKTIDIPDVVPRAQAAYVMVVKCGLLNTLLNAPAH